MLFRFRGLAVAVVVGAAILGLAASARPSFLASGGRAALEQQLDLVNRWGAGLRVSRYGPLSGNVRVLEFGEEMQLPLPPAADFDFVPLPDLVDDVTRRLDEATRGVESLGDGTLMMVGSQVSLTGEDAIARGRLITRTDALANVTKVAGSGNDGVWIADVTARQLGAAPGQTVQVAIGDATSSVRVAGIYRYLVRDRPREYWAPAREFIFRGSSEDAEPPALVIAPREEFLRLSKDFTDVGLVQWNYPIRAEGLSLPQARAGATDLTEVIRRHLTSEDSTIYRALATDGGFFGGERSRSTAMPSVVEAAARRVQSLQGPVDVLSIAALLVALVVMGAAGFYLVQRRRVEFVYLASRGISPASLGLKAAVESIAPAALGCAVGLLIGVPMSGLVGPGGDVPVESIPDSLRAAGGALLVGLALVGVVVAVTTEKEAGDEPHGRRERITAKLSWEPILGAVGGLLLWRVVQGSESIGSRESATINIDVLLLPVVGVLGGAGLIARGLRWSLPRFTRRARRWSPSRYLAARRLAGSSRAAVALVTACAFSVGVLVYSTTIARSTRTSVLAKAQIFTGSDFSAELAQSPATPALPFPSTYVAKFRRVSLAPGDRTARALGIDPSTFADAAYWEESFSTQELPALLRALEQSGEGVNAIAVGQGFPADIAFLGGGITIPVNVVGTARSFPGQLGRTPMLVMDKDDLENVAGTIAGATGGRRDELWARGDPGPILRSLNERGVLYFSTNSIAEVLESPSLQSLLWSLGLLRTLGIAAGVISVAGLVLYLQSRERASTVVRALTRRMSFTSRGYLKMLILEVGGLLGAAFVVGASLGLGVSMLLEDRFDLSPDLPPALTVEVPLVTLALAAVLVAVTAVVSAWRMQRLADRANVAEVMRVV